MCLDLERAFASSCPVQTPNPNQKHSRRLGFRVEGFRIYGSGPKYSSARMDAEEAVPPADVATASVLELSVYRVLVFVVTPGVH